MRKVNLTLAYGLFISCVSIFTLPSSTQARTRGIIFEKLKNWKEVLSIAKAQHKNIFVDAYTTWCGPCKMMDQQTYPDSTLGALINKDYISVKIQMDSSAIDDSYTRSWYTDAKSLMKSAKIEAFPSLLFYSPDGDLVLKTIGYKSPKALHKIATYALGTDAAKKYQSDLITYQQGKKVYSKLPDMILTTREAVGDQTLALAMARDYKTNYLDKLSKAKFLKPENIRFIAENGGAALVSTKDLFFKTCYDQPQLIDSILGKGSADYCIKMVIDREISEMLFRDKKPIVLDPVWSKLETYLGKYRKLDVERLLLKGKEDFYRRIENWEVYTKLKSDEIKADTLHGAIVNNAYAFYNLNAPAWDIFLHSNDKTALIRALSWIDLAMEMPQPNIQFYDTKANLLYKIGRIQEAINLQKLAVEKNVDLIKKEGRDYFPDYSVNLEKMQKNQPTWPVKK